MGEETRGVAPYVPFSTFETGLDKLAALGGLPPKIDHTVFQQMGGLAKGQVISAFKFLGLIDGNGTPAPLLSELVLDKDKRREIMRALIKSQYPNITEQDLATMSPSQLDAKLEDEGYNVKGSTKQKARTFLLKAAEFAGIPLSKLLTAKGPRGPRGKRAKPTNTKQNNNEVKGTQDGSVRQQPPPSDPNLIRMPIALAPDRVA